MSLHRQRQNFQIVATFKATDEAAVGIKNCGAYGNPALGETLAGFGECDGKHCGVVRLRLHVSCYLPPEIMPLTVEKTKRDESGSELASGHGGR